MKLDSGIGKRRSAAQEDSTESYQMKRREIIDAGIRVFDRVGFQGASMKAVADELAGDRASIYYYFSSKEALFDEAVRTVVERNLALIKTIQAGDGSVPEKLRALIVGLMTSYGEHYPTFYIYIRENLSHVSDGRSDWSREMRALNKQSTDAVIAMIEQGYRDGTLRYTGSARVVAYGIFGLIGWTHRWFRPDRSELSAAEVGEIYANMALSGLVK